MPPSQSARVYCSKSCARTALNLTPANPSLHRDLTGANNPMFGVRRTGPANPMYGRRRDRCPRWRGGRKVRADGYVVVIAPAGHPHPCEVTATGELRILEHRLVMEHVLGRYLTPEEVVHHIDGNPSNNDQANLELLPDQAAHAKRHAADRQALP